MIRVLLFFVLWGIPLEAQSLQVPKQISFSNNDLEKLIGRKIDLGCDSAENKVYYSQLINADQPNLKILSLLFQAQDAARCYDRINSVSEARFKEALQLSRNQSLPLLVYAQVEYANYLYRFRYIAKAFSYFLAIEQNLDNPRFKDPIQLHYVLQSLGHFYGFIGAHQDAIDKFASARELQVSQSSEQGSLIAAMGTQYLAIGDLNKARTLLVQARNDAYHTKDERNYAKVLTDLAIVEMRNQNSESALPLLLESLKISKRLSHTEAIIAAQTELAKLYYSRGEHQQALKILTAVTPLYQSKTYFAKEGIEVEILKLEIYQNQGIVAKELETYRTLTQLEKFLETLDGNKTLANAHILLQKLKWQKSINLNRYEQVKRQRQQVFYIIIFSLVVLLSAFIFLNQRQRVRSERLVNLDKVKSLELLNLRAESELSEAKRNLGVQLNDLKKKTMDVQSLRLELQTAKQAEQEFIIKRQQEIAFLLKSHLMTDENWELFKLDFMVVHRDFYQALKTNFPELRESHFRFLFLKKLGMTITEISDTLGLTKDAIKKSNQRLKKRLGERYGLLEALLKDD